MDQVSIGDYLIQQIYEKGVRHVFGVPGDYVLKFYNMLTASKLIVVNTCDEQGAGFAADAYARLNGLGVVCVTYGVGGLKVINTTAQAYAEKSPVIVISGSPGINERTKNPLLHHKVKEFDTQKKVFDEITVASTVLDKPEDAKNEIDNAISLAIRYKRPAYIELPRDIISKPITNRHNNNYNSYTAESLSESSQKSDRLALREAVNEAVSMINSALMPVIIAGVEIQRFGLKKQLIQFIDKSGIPAATTILSKSVIDSLHPLYIGVYAGAIGQGSVREYVETSDCIIMLGAMMTDIDLGIFTAKIDSKKTINVSTDGISISYHHYSDILIQDFIQALTHAKVHPRKYKRKSIPHFRPRIAYPSNSAKKITIKYVFERLNSFLTPNMLVITDVGDALFAGTDLLLTGNNEFLSPAYYASLGFSIPASLGTKLAKPDLRPIVIVGDGAFQMTGIELSTALRFHINPIVIVLNNCGYLTERLMIDGPFNDIQRWQYSNIPKLIGGGRGCVVETEEQFDNAIKAATSYVEEFSILDVRLDPFDKSPALHRLTRGLAGRLK